MSVTTLKSFARLHDYEEFFQASCDERARDSEAIAQVLQGMGHGDWLDFGCGDGRLLERILDLTSAPPNINLSLVDIDGAYLNEAAERLKKHNVHSFVDWPNGEFDVILANHVLYYVPDLAGWLERAHKALRPEGRLCILMGASDTPFGSLWSKLFAKLDEKPPYFTLQHVAHAMGDLSHGTVDIPFRLDFLDTKKNREHLLRFLLGEHYARIEPTGCLAKSLDPFVKAGRIVAEHRDVLFVVRKS